MTAAAWSSWMTSTSPSSARRRRSFCPSSTRRGVGTAKPPSLSTDQLQSRTRSGIFLWSLWTAPATGQVLALSLESRGTRPLSSLTVTRNQQTTRAPGTKMDLLSSSLPKMRASRYMAFLFYIQQQRTTPHYTLHTKEDIGCFRGIQEDIPRTSWSHVSQLASQ